MVRREAKRPDHRNWLLGGALVLLVLGAYSSVIARGGFVWDDDYHVTNNVHLRTLGGLWEIWSEVAHLPPNYEPGVIPQYYPLTHTTFWVEYHLWKDWATGYHVTNVLLHAVSAVLLWRLLAGLTVPGAWLIAALFAVHPVHVESVAWITERKNVLSGVFYLLAMAAYLRAIGLVHGQRVAGRTQDGVVNWRWYGAAAGLFLAALLSKTVTASLPAAVLLLIWWKRGRIDLRRDVVPLLPFFAAGIAFGLLTSWMERHIVGAIGNEWDIPWRDRAMIAGRAAWFYARELLWPAKLTFIYERWQVDAGDWRWWAWPASAVALVAALFLLRKRLGRGPLVAALFFGGTLFPALGFADVFPMKYSFVADHFQYLASIGMIALVVGAVVTVAAAHLDRAPRVYARAAAAAVLLVLAGLTWRQGLIYATEETLWRDTLDKNQTGAMAANNYGFQLLLRGDLDAAEPWFHETLRRDRHHAWAAVHLAEIAERRKDLPGAINWAREAVRIYSTYPEGSNGYLVKADMHFRLGHVLASAGRTDDSAAEYQAALRINPKHALARTNLVNLYTRQGIALFQDGDGVSALRLMDLAVKTDPSDARTYNNRGTILLNLGRVDAAIADYRKALQLDPNMAEAQRNLVRSELQQRPPPGP